MVSGVTRSHVHVMSDSPCPSLISLLFYNWLLADPPTDTDPAPPSASHCVQLLAAVSTHPSLLSTILTALTNYLQHLSQLQPFSEEHQHLARVASGSMLAIVEGNIVHEACTSLVNESTLKDILALCIQPVVSCPPPQQHILMDETVLSNFATLLRCYTQALDIR